MHRLLMSCVAEGDKFFIYMPTGTLSRKKVCKKRGTCISQHIIFNTVLYTTLMVYSHNDDAYTLLHLPCIGSALQKWLF